MTERNNELGNLQQDAAICAENLLRLYSFEVGGYMPDQLLSRWLTLYPTEWVRLAVVEALYQGRYKSVSVEQILSFWRRRGEPVPHFNLDFDRMVCSKLPRAMPSRFSTLGSGLSLGRGLSSGLGGRPPRATPRPFSSQSLVPLGAAAPTSDRTPDASLKDSDAPAAPDRTVEQGTDPEHNTSAIAKTSPHPLPSALKLPYLEPLTPSPKQSPMQQPLAVDNLVPLPVRPTTQSIPSSQVGSYNLRTEEGRRQFLETMRGLLSKQNGPKQELPALPEAQTPETQTPETQTLDVAASRATMTESSMEAAEPEITPALTQPLMATPEAEAERPKTEHPLVTSPQENGSTPQLSEASGPELSGAEALGSKILAEELNSNAPPMTSPLVTPPPMTTGGAVIGAPIDARPPEQLPHPSSSASSPVARFVTTSTGYSSHTDHSSSADYPSDKTGQSLIHQFTPRANASDFYAKLKSVALPDGATAAPDDTVSPAPPDDSERAE